MTALFNLWVLFSAADFRRGVEDHPNVMPLLTESEFLVDLAGLRVRLGDLELELPVAPLARPVRRPQHEVPSDAPPAMRGCDPHVVHVAVLLRRQEPAAGPEEQVPEEPARRVLRDPRLRAAAIDIRLDPLPEV